MKTTLLSLFALITINALIPASASALTLRYAQGTSVLSKRLELENVSSNQFYLRGSLDYEIVGPDFNVLLSYDPALSVSGETVYSNRNAVFTINFGNGQLYCSYPFEIYVRLLGPRNQPAQGFEIRTLVPYQTPAVTIGSECPADPQYFQKAKWAGPAIYR